MPHSYLYTRLLATITTFFLAFASPAFSDSQVLFHIPFDDNALAFFEDYVYPAPDNDYGGLIYQEGVIGKAASFEHHRSGLFYPIAEVFNPAEGSISLWVRWIGKDSSLRCMILPGDTTGDSLACSGMRNLDIRKALSDGEWHHFVYTWDLKSGFKHQYLDGKPAPRGKGYYRTPYLERNFVLGAGYYNMLDEFILLDRALPQNEVVTLYSSYKKGKQPFENLPDGNKQYYPLDISDFPDASPAIPAKIDWNLDNPTALNPARSEYSLAGFWRFQPMPFMRKRPVDTDWLYLRLPSAWLPVAESVVFDTTLAPLPNFVYADWKVKKAAKDAMSAAFEATEPAIDDLLLDIELEEDPNPYRKDPGLWNGRPLDASCTTVLERDLPLPDKLAGKQLLLIFPDIYPTAEVYLNGRHAGATRRGEAAPVNITEPAKPGENNKLTLLLGAPFRPTEMAGITKAPLLQVRDTRLFELGKPLIIPSYRNSKLTILLPTKNLSDITLDLSVTAKLYDKNGATLEKTLGPVNAAIPPGMSGEDATIEFPAGDLKEWTPETPNLYTLVLEIGHAGKTADITLPERFGFREVWVENEDLLINGKRLTLRGKSHGGWYSLNELTIKLMRDLGMNSTRTMGWGHDFPEMPGLDAADEGGFVVNIPVWGVNTANKEEARKEFRKLLGIFGNHPSVIEWQIGSRAHHNGPHGHPMQIGGVISEETRRDNPFFVRSDVLNEIDPTGRPTFYYTSGVGGNTRGIMMSLSFGTPIQEIEEWASNWAENRPEPLILREPQIFSRPDLFFQRGSSESAVLENHARYFGEEAYRKATEPLIESWKDIGEMNWCTPEYWTDFYTLAYERAVRSWRTYGIGGFWFHASYHLQTLYEKSRRGGDLTPWGKAVKEFNAPCIFYIGGPETDFTVKDHNYFSGESVSKSAIVVNDTFHDINGSLEWEARLANGSVLASSKMSVTAPQGKRLFRPIVFKCGDVKSRSEIIVTARFIADGEPLSLEDSFKLTVFPKPAPAALSKPIAVLDPKGDTVAVLKEMKLPHALLTGKNHAQLDSFDMLLIGKNSFQSLDETLDPATLNLAVENGLNVVVLEQTTRNTAGLTADCQKTRRVFMLNPQSSLLADFQPADFIDWRGASDMLPAYPPWHEDSAWQARKSPANLLPCKHGQANSFGQRRFWHWSNKGIVNTFCYQKPQLGNFTIFLQNGFDTQYTPLVSFRKGKGTILFSQLELTGSYNKDPVATILFHMILEKYSVPADKEFKPISFLGGANGKYFLEQLGAEHTDGLESGTAFVSLSETDDPEQIKKFVGSGGVLIVSPQTQEDADKLPVKIVIEEKKARVDDSSTDDGPVAPSLDETGVGAEPLDANAVLSMLQDDAPSEAPAASEDAAFAAMPTKDRTGPDSEKYFKTGLPDDPALAGLSLGDLYYRDSLKTISRVKSVNGVETDHELIGVVHYEKGRIIYVQPDFSEYDDPWQQTKIIRLFNVIFSNLGIANSNSPDFSLVGGLGMPEEWLSGYSVAIPENDLKNRPMVEESPLYWKPALNFDPDAHYVW